MRRSEAIVLGVIVLSFIIGIYFYPRMPGAIASHWNIRGEVDGYMSKFWGLFLMPFISVGLLLLFALIPKIDPLKANIEQFRNYYDGLILVVIVFLFYLYLLTIFWNMGPRFDMIQLLAPACGILLYCCGIVIENVKRNWFIGIRTPWTLSHDRVWEKTHKIGGRLFKISGVIALFGVLFRGYAIFFIVVPAILIAVYTTVYSYREYQKETR